MGIFKNANDATAGELSPIDQVRAALEAIDVAPHVDRLESCKANVKARENAIENARNRLQEINAEIREHREPDGEKVAFALLNRQELPPVPESLEREKEQLLQGIRALNRQISEMSRIVHQRPWADLITEITGAINPLVENFQQRAQALVDAAEELYAETESLVRYTKHGSIDGIRRVCGAMVIEARESRYVTIRGTIPVDPALSALTDTEPFKVMKGRVRDSVETPSRILLNR